LPERYFLRTIGISFVMLAWLEFKIAADLPLHRELALVYAVTPTAFFITIALQMATTGFNGASWFWWLNLLVTGVFAVAMFAAHKRQP
jgi:hypothetical protein